MKLLLLESRCHGHITIPTIAQMYEPRRMFRYLGKRAVMSVPADTLLAAIFVPSCASTKEAAMTKTPKRVPLPTFGSLRKRSSKSSGFQMGSSYMTDELEDTIMPMKLVKAKPHGMVNS